MARTPNQELNSLRIDRWLWAARFYKTRALAAAAIKGGKVHSDGLRAKPSRTVKVGDRLEISRGEDRIELEVLAVSAKRGPATAAAMLYRESLESLARRTSATETRRFERLVRPDFGRRPDKRSRRRLRHLTGKDGDQ